MSYNFTGTNVTAVVDFDEATCTFSPYFTKTERYPSGLTYHDIILIVSAVTTALCVIFSVALASVHLSNWVKPKEQKQLVRIIIFAPISAIFSLFSVWFYGVSWFLEPFPELYECFALVAMFYLLVLYVAPHEAHWDDFFGNLQRFGVVRNKPKPKHTGGSLRWFKMMWVMVFQVLPAKFLLNLANWILSGVMCPLKFRLSREATAVSVIESIATSICVMGIVWFARRMAPELKQYKVVYKLLSFKGIVGITLTQAPVFQLFAEYGWFKRTAYVSDLDFVVGTPAFMTCVEMCIVSVIFLWTFSATQYVELSKELPRTKRFGAAALDVLDARDIFHGIWYMCKIAFCCGGRSRSRGSGKDLGGNNGSDLESDTVEMIQY